MKLADAKPGDILRDKDGDVWVVESGYVACVVERGRAYLGDGDCRWAAHAAEHFGPFARLVPEEAAEW